MPRKKIKIDPINAYIPIGLDIHELLRGTEFDGQRMCLILHQFYVSRDNQKQHFDNDEFRRDKLYEQDGWIPLNSELLKIIGTKHYADYLRFLEDSGVISVKRTATGYKSYSAGGSSALYKINKKYLHHPHSKNHFKKIEITKPVLIRQVKKLKDGIKQFYQNDKTFLPLLPIHKEMIGMLWQLRFDMEGMEKYFNEIAQGKIIVDHSRSGKDKTKEDFGDMLDAANAFNDRVHLPVTVGKFGERLYHPITNTWKELRRFLYFTDAPENKLVSLDISNSQPYFSSICIEPRIIESLLPEYSECIPHLKKFNTQHDLINYSNLCSSGNIYKEWAKLRCMELPDAKLDFIANVMYSRNFTRNKQITLPKQIFKQHFPSVHAVFDFIKHLSESELPFITDIYLKRGRFEGKKSYFKNLCCAMTRLESRIFTRYIWPALLNQEFRFISVHDCVIVEEKNKGVVMDLMLKQFIALGISPPKIKEELLDKC